MKLKMKRDGSYRLHLNQAELEALFEYVNNTEVDANSVWDSEEDKELKHELNQFGWDLFHLTIPRLR